MTIVYFVLIAIAATVATKNIAIKETDVVIEANSNEKNSEVLIEK